MSATLTVEVRRVSGFKPGQRVVIATDSEGVPLDKFWRRRLRDSKVDGCCEVVTPAEVIMVEEPES